MPRSVGITVSAVVQIIGSAFSILVCGSVSAKILAETLLFFANFAAQRRFVFGSRNAVPASR
jgi:hypothetical protein